MFLLDCFVANFIDNQSPLKVIDCPISAPFDGSTLQASLTVYGYFASSSETLVDSFRIFTALISRYYIGPILVLYRKCVDRDNRLATLAENYKENDKEEAAMLTRLPIH